MLRRISILYFLIFCLPIVSFGQTKSEKTEKQRAMTALEAQIKDMQKQIGVGTLITRETNTRNARTAARNEANKAKKEVEAAEQEYRDALANLRSNPQSQTARAAVNIAQQHLEEANTNLQNKEAQANVADDSWQAAENELRRERARLSEFRQLLKKLETDEISPGEVLTQVLVRFIPDISEQDGKTVIVTNAAVKTVTVFDTVSIVDTLSLTDTVFVAQNSELVKWLISARLELATGHLGDDAAALGGSIEGGVIINRIYITGDVSISGFGGGGGVNVGWCFNRDGLIKIVPGASAGFFNTNHINRITTPDGKTEKGTNRSIAGFFAKIIGGKTSNIDMTYKLLFGSDKIPLSLSEDNRLEYKKDSAVRHSLGIGYTFMKAKKQKGEKE
jgi:hypothetical protein